VAEKDASVSSFWNRTSIEICLGNEEGTFILAQTMSSPTKYSVDVGEVLDLFNVLQWSANMQFHSVDFVVVSNVTTDAFNSRRYDATEFGQVIITCQNIFSSSFANSRVEFSRRQANVDVHLLVGEATLSVNPTIYFVVSIVSILLLSIKYEKY